MTFYVDNVTSEGLLDYKSHRTQTAITTVSASTLTLTVTSEEIQVFQGTTAGQVVKMPDATTLTVGYRYWIHNDSTQTVTVQDNSGTQIFALAASERLILICVGTGTAAGSWTYLTVPKSRVLPFYKAGTVSSGSFTGNPKTASVTFTTAFANTNYAVTVTGIDARTWTISNVATTGFTINANANAALTGNVFWHAIANGESQ